MGPPGSGQFDIFFTYVIKVDKREVLRLYLKHICVLLLFLVSPVKLPFCSQLKVNNFGSYPLFDPLDHANLTCFFKVDKREVLGLHFKYIYVLLFLVFPGKLPLYSLIE